MTLRKLTALVAGFLVVIPALALAMTPALASDRDPGNNTADTTYVSPALGQATATVPVISETGKERIQ